jgi:hypothetical protein
MMLLKLRNGPPTPAEETTLPPFLRQADPQEIESLPLQVSLLTMEIAAQRIMLQRLSVILEAASRMLTGPGLDLGDDCRQQPPRS